MSQTPGDTSSLAECALQAAWRRLAGATSNMDQLISLGECLMWLAALDESHRDSSDDRRYRGAGDSRPQAQQVGGAIYARNLIQHQLADVGRLTDSYQDTYSNTFGSYTWRPLTELPRPGRPEKQLRDQHYVDHLEGRSALDTMRDMIAFLTRT